MWLMISCCQSLTTVSASSRSAVSREELLTGTVSLGCSDGDKDDAKGSDDIEGSDETDESNEADENKDDVEESDDVDDENGKTGEKLSGLWMANPSADSAGLLEPVDLTCCEEIKSAPLRDLGSVQYELDCGGKYQGIQGHLIPQPMQLS